MRGFHRRAVFGTGLLFCPHAQVAPQAEILDAEQQGSGFVAPAHDLGSIRLAPEFAAIISADDFFHGLSGMAGHELGGGFFDDAFGDDRVTLFLGVAQDGHARHAACEGGHPFHAGLCLLGPGGAHRSQPVNLGLVLTLAQQHRTGRVIEQVFGVAADIEFGIGMDARGTQHQQAGFEFIQVTIDDFMGLAVQQHGFHFHAVIRCDGLRHRQVALVNFSQTGIDDFLMELFLLLKPEYLAGFFREHAGNTVEGNIVVIGVEGGNHLHIAAPGFCQTQGGEQPAIGFGRTVHAHDDGAVTE